jgi:hypothetical protein
LLNDFNKWWNIIFLLANSGVIAKRRLLAIRNKTCKFTDILKIEKKIGI